MESISENTDKNNESGDPNDSVEKLNTEIVENVIQPECSHPAEKLEEINTSSASSNNKTIEDIDIDDIVLLTESLPVIEDCVENNKNIDSNTVNKESEEQAVNQSENVNIDSIQLIEATENETAPEKCDDEPMDIDEILNSLGVDFDVPSSSEASSSQTVTENTVETSNIEKQTGKEEEEVVLLTDDEENENEPKNEKSTSERDFELEKTNETEETTNIDMEKLVTDLDADERAPVQSGEEKSPLPVTCPVAGDIIADTTADPSMVKNTTENDDIVMLSDDESGEKANETEVSKEPKETVATVEETPLDSKQSPVVAKPAEITVTEAAKNDVSTIANPENLECSEHVDESLDDFTDDLLLENDNLFAKADELIQCEAKKVNEVQCTSDVNIPVENERVGEEVDFQIIEKSDSIEPAKEVDDVVSNANISSETEKSEEKPEEKSEEKLEEKSEEKPEEKPEEKSEEKSEEIPEEKSDVQEMEESVPKSDSDAKSTIENEKVDEETLDVQMADGDDKTTDEKIEEIQQNATDATAALPLESEKDAKESTEEAMDESDVNQTERTTPSKMEVDIPEADVKPVPVYRECLNLECPKRSDNYYLASEFIVNHFHLSKRPKIAYVCEHCYDSVTEHYGELCAALEDKQPLFLKMSKKSNLIEVIDSSDEEGDSESQSEDIDGNSFDADTLAMIENELETVITETLRRVDIEQQMDWNRQLLQTKIENNEKNCIEMMREVKSLQTRIDTLYTNTYKIRHNFVEEVQSLDVKTMKPTQICNEHYPPAGEPQYPDIAYNTLYYTFRKHSLARWLPCKVIDMVPVSEEKFDYSVRICHDTREFPIKKGVLRQHLAYGRAPEYRLNIGTRVIASFNDMESTHSTTKQKDKTLKNNFRPGVVAEPLSLYTHWRYLVFFDHGHSQYVYHENVRVVCEPVEKVWELIEEPGAKAFVEGYIKELKKKRPIIQAKQGQKIQTENDGKWYNNVIVNNVDGSLVQMYFEDLKKYDWIYRGSTRFMPLYQKLKQAKQAKSGIDTVFEYITIDDDKEPERTTEPPVEEISPDKTAATTAEQPTADEGTSEASEPAKTTRTFASQAARDTPQQKQREQKRAVAKKSTAPQPKPTIQHMNNSTIYVDEDNPKGKVIYYTAKRHLEVKKYIHHECQPSCLIQIKHNLSSYSPLSKPLLSGFERQICKTRFNKKFVLYRAPCGRRLRDMDEMHRYLRMTNCELNVDNFTFDPLIHCLAEYVIEEYVVKKADLSDGIEKMPVQLINQYDTTQPPPCTYSAKRIPTEGVNLTLDPEFLCGCDCTDDCADKSKCACWQLTLQGAKYGNPEIPISEVGYEYKRLNDPVPTGIYECNSQCKCKSNCLNRVVQYPLQLKLQVFKTGNRGWGLRCLNDVPKGSFICCYAGNLLTETAANDAGEDLGDEYFAELDYIEVVENMKEGYEPEVINEDTDESSSSTDEDFDFEKERSRNDDSDGEFKAHSRYTTSEDSESRRYRTRNSVDTRKKPEQSTITTTTTTTTKDIERRKERSSSSDEDGDGIRPVKNFMASTSMPLTNEPEEEKRKSIRKMYGKNEAVYIMDAKKAGNIGRYFNHSCGPNLFVQNVFVDTHDLRFPWVAFFASTHIRAGTELTWNYNYEVGSVPNKVLICQCGDVKCRGRIL